MAAFFIKQLALGPMQNFSYLLGDTETRKIAVIDPGWEANRIAEEARKADMTMTAILLTHTHFDHIKALGDLLQFIQVPVYVHRLEAGNLKGIECIATDDGTVIPVGNVKVRCHHTPGHSPGGQCFEVGAEHAPPVLITGDTLFVNACGRIDLPGSDPQAMTLSLRKLATFPPVTVIYPGHDYGPTPTSTIGEQLKTNPFLKEART